MILPIVLTGRLGLPGGGVPNFTIDPNTGEVIGGKFWPQGAGAADPATGEPVTTDSTFTSDAALWNTAGKGGADPNVLDTGALWNTRGTQWHRRGSLQSESGFDKWRRAGKPTACSMGDYTLPDGTSCDPTVVGGAVCQDSTQRILEAIAAGASAAARGQQPYYTNVPGTPGYIPPAGGTLTVSGGASTGAWIFGGLIVVGLVYAVTHR